VSVLIRFGFNPYLIPIVIAVNVGSCPKTQLVGVQLARVEAFLLLRSWLKLKVEAGRAEYRKCP